MHRYTLSYFVDSIVVLLLFACLLYSHEYDKCGRVTRITHDCDKIEEQTYSYNSLGLPVEVCCGTHLMERSDEKHGLIVSLRSSLELSSAMSVMLMASWFDSGQTKPKDLIFDYAVYGSTSPLKIKLPLV